MRRREFIILLGGATAWPLMARAQQAERMRRMAVVIGGTEEAWSLQVAAFRQALEQLGWREAYNLQTDIRWGNNDREHIAALARDVVSGNPDVILSGPSNTVIQVQKHTRTIPIVFVNVPTRSHKALWPTWPVRPEIRPASATWSFR